jgi:hypothetical protein
MLVRYLHVTNTVVISMKSAQREDCKLAIDSDRRVKRSDRKQSFTLVSSPTPSPPKDDDNEVFIIAHGLEERGYSQTESDAYTTVVLSREHRGNAVESKQAR